MTGPGTDHSSSPVPRLRLVHIVEASGGGLGRHVLDIAGDLRSTRFEQMIVFSGLRADGVFREGIARLLGEGRVQVHEIPMPHAIRPFGDMRAVWQIHRLLSRQEGMLLIHGHSSKGGAYARIVSTLLGRRARSVYTPNAFVFLDRGLSRVRRMVYWAFEWLLAPMTDLLVCVSPSEETASRGLPLIRRRRVIPNSVPDRAIGRDPEARSRIRRELGIPQDGFVVGSVGRLSHQKAPGRFASVAVRLTSEDRRIHAVWIGDGPLRDRFIEVFQPNEQRRFLGYRDDARDLIQTFDAFALLSRYEGQPYAILEALAAGVPVVGTSVPGISDTLTEDVGWLVPEEQWDQAADILSGISGAEGVDELTRKSEQAVTLIRSNHNRAQSMALLEGAYLSLFD